MRHASAALPHRFTSRFRRLAYWREVPLSGDEQTFGLASDVAANVFVVLFMAVLIGLVARPAASEPVDYELKGALRLTERRPNTAVDLVNALHRRQSGNGASLDLLADRLRLSSSGVVRTWAWEDIAAIQAALQSVGKNERVDLFVFDPRGYAIARDALDGRRVTEVSVPIALRSCTVGANCPDGSDWSQGFQSLLGRPMTDATFRQALADLLAARPQPSRPVPAAPAGASSDQPVDASLSTASASWLPNQAYGLIAILILVLLVEGLSHRTRRP